ncbi:MAG: Ig domain-containing protein [Oscillospiraceae bacterium]|jgi:hypothetical protein|nr:Ig domain-containing protein [Oscillospiraceae bacterium]
MKKSLFKQILPMVLAVFLMFALCGVFGRREAAAEDGVLEIPILTESITLSGQGNRLDLGNWDETLTVLRLEFEFGGGTYSGQATVNSTDGWNGISGTINSSSLVMDINTQVTSIWIHAWAPVQVVRIVAFCTDPDSVRPSNKEVVELIEMPQSSYTFLINPPIDGTLVSEIEFIQSGNSSYSEFFFNGTDVQRWLGSGADKYVFSGPFPNEITEIRVNSDKTFTAIKIYVNPPNVPDIAPEITTGSLPDGKVAEQYEGYLDADGTMPIVWTLESGNLPNGLNLASNGKIYGTPTASGTFTFTVKAANGVDPYDTKEFTVVIEISTAESESLESSRSIYESESREAATSEYLASSISQSAWESESRSIAEMETTSDTEETATTESQQTSESEKQVTSSKNATWNILRKCIDIIDSLLYTLRSMF